MIVVAMFSSVIKNIRETGCTALNLSHIWRMMLQFQLYLCLELRKTLLFTVPVNIRLTLFIYIDYSLRRISKNGFYKTHNIR